MTKKRNQSIEELLRNVDYHVNKIADLLTVKIRGSVPLEYVQQSFKVFRESLIKKDLNETIDSNSADNSLVSSTVLSPAAVSTPIREKKSLTSLEKKATKTVNLFDFICEKKSDPNAKFTTIYGQRKAIDEIKSSFCLPVARKSSKNFFSTRYLMFNGHFDDDKEEIISAIANEYNLKLYVLNFNSLSKDLYSSVTSIQMNVNGASLVETAMANQQKVLVYLSDLDVFETNEFSCKSRVRYAIKLFDELLDELRKHSNLYVIGSCKNTANINDLLDTCSKTFVIVDFLMPTHLERIAIFNQWKSEMPQFEFDVDANTFADATSGYGMKILEFLFDELYNISSRNAVVGVSDSTFKVTEAHFDEALTLLKKSTGYQTHQLLSIPKVKWDDIGSLQSLKNDIKKILSKYVSCKENQGLSKIMGNGIVLFGPPGCGKTLVAKALANEKRFTYMYVAGGDFLNKYVGDSTKAVRDKFQKARENAPTIMMLDEIDVMCPKRDDSVESSKVAEQVVAAFLTEMDGVQERGDVFVIAATNRIEKVDRALLRPGRFNKIYYVGLPTATDRADILRTICRSNKISIADDVDFEAIAFDNRCHNFSGADLTNLIDIATDIMENKQSDCSSRNIDQQSLSDALNQCQASNLDNVLEYYENCRQEYAQNRI